VHVPSEQHYRELHTVPEFVRITLASGRDGWEPTLLVKSSTLTLKYLTQLRSTSFVAALTPEGHLLYGLRVLDDIKHPAFIWSVAESADEFRALRALSSGREGYLFLFNEAAVNVAWAPWTASGDTATLSKIATVAKIADHDPHHGSLHDFIENLFGRDSNSLRYISSELGLLPWTELQATYITNSLTESSLLLFADDEGSQQEELCHWLTDTLQPKGVWRSPQLVTETKRRELTDFLLSHSYGAFLVESKALALLQRKPLPDRAELICHIVKHVAKAVRQLGGAIRNIRAGQRITDAAGAELEIERVNPPHAIILVPDLNLLHDELSLGRPLLTTFMAKHHSFLHILDPIQLFRVAQAAHMIAARGEKATVIEALDCYLMRRFEHALESEGPDFDVILRIEEAASPT
jgi:hypothetical protein